MSSITIQVDQSFEYPIPLSEYSNYEPILNESATDFSSGDNLTLVHALRKPEVMNRVLEFAKREHSEENIYAWESVRRYHDGHSSERRPAIARDIIHRYVQRDSPHEVNINEEVRRDILDRASSFEFNDSLFIDMEREVEANLTDIFFRFRNNESSRASSPVAEDHSPKKGPKPEVMSITISKRSALLKKAKSLSPLSVKSSESVRQSTQSLPTETKRRGSFLSFLQELRRPSLG